MISENEIWVMTLSLLAFPKEYRMGDIFIEDKKHDFSIAAGIYP